MRRFWIISIFWIMVFCGFQCLIVFINMKYVLFLVFLSFLYCSNVFCWLSLWSHNFYKLFTMVISYITNAFFNVYLNPPFPDMLFCFWISWCGIRKFVLDFSRYFFRLIGRTIPFLWNFYMLEIRVIPFKTCFPQFSVVPHVKGIIPNLYYWFFKIVFSGLYAFIIYSFLVSISILLISSFLLYLFCIISLRVSLLNPSISLQIYFIHILIIKC